MKKLLLLAALGLGLGGGVWKAQHPDGSLEDLKTQAMASVERVKTGVNAGIDAVVARPEKVAAGQQSLESRLEAAEQSIAAIDSEKLVAEVQTIVETRLSEGATSLSNIQDTIEHRVVPVESLTVAVAQLDTALSDTRARTDAGNVRLDTIDKRLELLVRRLDEQTTEADLLELSESVSGIQAQLDSTMKSLKDNESATSNEIAAIDEKASNLELRLKTLVSATNQNAELSQTDASTTTTSNNGTDASQTNSNSSLLAFSAGIDERLNGIETRLATVNSDSRRIASLTEQLQTANSKIAELEQTNTQSSQTISQLTESVDALETAGKSLSIDAIQDQIREQLESAQSQFDNTAAETNTSQLEALLESTRSRIETLEQQVQKLPAASSEANDAVQVQSTLQSQIVELEERLESLTSADPASESTVKDVKTQVEQLSALGFVTQDDLRTKTKSAAIEYKIYFDRNSTDITEDAAKVLNSFIAQEKNRTTGVSIFGFTDRSGSAVYNQQLALQRATNVRTYLIQNGLDYTKITALTGLGEDAAAAILPDEAADAQQRVVVLYAAQP